MNSLKKILGILWMLLGIAAAYFGILQLGFPKLTSGKQDDLVFGIIVLFVLTPIISIGLLIFGYYSIKNEYSDENL